MNKTKVVIDVTDDNGNKFRIISRMRDTEIEVLQRKGSLSVSGITGIANGMLEAIGREKISIEEVGKAIKDDKKD